MPVQSWEEKWGFLRQFITIRVFQQINHPCFDAIAPNKALLARAGGLCPCSPTLQGAGFLKVLFFG
ncbi:hypothetical protein, partial [Oscillatoria sp. HE19RPO]|uniref:hypothetical protein n=1 Tax=Oscillatoria sp. HE19RPO TaxID=2954806 RepID=UPI0020C520A9